MPSDTDGALGAFTTTLRDRGLRNALATLLQRTDYRFIGLWRFEDGRARAAVHYDRENPDLLTSDEVPASATYCSRIHRSARPFATADARSDQRLLEHPARDSVLSYCGVPVMDDMGQVLATLCHYDLVPRDPEQIDLELMVNVAGMLAAGKHVPPYPRDAS